MHSKNFYAPACLADQSSVKERPIPLDRSPQQATSQLTRRAALTVVLALSLGLWAVVWVAVASLASAAFG